MAILDVAERTPIGSVAHPAEQTRSRVNVCLQNGSYVVTKCQVCVTNNCGDLGTTLFTCCGCLFHNKPGLAHGGKFDWTIEVVFSTALNKHGLGDVVASVGVGPQLLGQVAAIRSLPEMVMWINDWPGRINCRLGAPGEPIVSFIYGHSLHLLFSYAIYQYWFSDSRASSVNPHI